MKLSTFLFPGALDDHLGLDDLFACLTLYNDYEEQVQQLKMKLQKIINTPHPALRCLLSLTLVSTEQL